MNNTPTRLVVDAFTRTLHALMALTFFLAYLTADTDTTGLRLIHVTLGYSFGGLLLLRLLWALLGPRRVSLLALLGRAPGPTRLLALLKGGEWANLLRAALPWSIAMLLLGALPLLAAGYVTYFDTLGEWTEDLHETLGNAMLLAALVHAGTMLVLHWLPGPGVRPMLSGRVPGPGPDLVRQPLRALALMVVLLLTGFWGWQGWQYLNDPQMRHPVSWLHPVGGPRSR